MKTGQFLNKLRGEAIAKAIHEAELKSSGEIRVFVTRKEVEDPVAAAEAQFLELSMDKTRDRNGVLIFVAPRNQKFAIVGDEAIHERCGEEFWKGVSEEMGGHFRKSDFTTGIIEGIKKAGELLARHFPRRDDDRNELPNKVEGD